MADLDFFFNPDSISVLGASSKPGKIGYAVLKSIIDAGYEHEIYPINISAEEILGLKTYKSILDVPGKVDLAVYTLPAKHAPQTVDECGKKGVRGIIIISGGFRELDGDGTKLERQTLENAKKHNIRIIGPNCVGILNVKAKFDTFFQPRYAMSRPKSGNIGVLTQSGTFGLSILECFTEEKLGVSKFVSYGNKADVDELDMLRYLEKDEETKIIVLYVEGLRNGKEFMRLAKNIGKSKPLVMLKAGRTFAGAKAAKSHTGSLSGDHAVFSGAMRQAEAVPETYKAKDGDVVASAMRGREERLAKLMGIELEKLQIEDRALRHQIMDEWISGKTRDEVVNSFAEARLPVAPVNSLEEVINDPHFLAREMIVEVDHPEVGKAKMPNFPTKFSETPVDPLEKPAPLLGQHNEEVLSTLLGYSKEEIAKLKEERVISP